MFFDKAQTHYFFLALGSFTRLPFKDTVTLISASFHSITVLKISTTWRLPFFITVNIIIPGFAFHHYQIYSGIKRRRKYPLLYSPANITGLPLYRSIASDVSFSGLLSLSPFVVELIQAFPSVARGRCCPN